MPTFTRKAWQGPRTYPANESAADALRQPPSHMPQNAADPYELKSLANRSHTVCFTGHRLISQKDEAAIARLAPLLEMIYQRGYRDFLCGGALGFDQIAAEHVVQLREKHPDVRLIFCLPCADQSNRWKEADCSHYEHLLYLSDETRVLSPYYYEGCMQVRNAYMVDRSYLCVAYMARLHGGTLSTVRYALSQDVPVVNIAVPTALAEFDQSL